MNLARYSYRKQMLRCEVLLVCQLCPGQAPVTSPHMHAGLVVPLLIFCLLDDASKDKTEGHFLTAVRRA